MQKWIYAIFYFSSILKDFDVWHPVEICEVKVFGINVGIYFGIDLGVDVNVNLGDGMVDGITGFQLKFV